MATKKDVSEFRKFIQSTEDEIDEFFTEKMGDIEIYLDERGFNEYSIIYETFDKIEYDKNNMISHLRKLKKLLSKVLATQ